MERPFSDQEKRFVLAEAIKNSSVPVESLLSVLHNVQPAWTLMLLPTGRNLQSCMEAFESLKAMSPTSSFPAPLPIPQAPPAAKRKSGPETLEPFYAGPAPKRQQPGAERMPLARNIQPKPALNGSPPAFSPVATGQPAKKRGRPSKADVEARHAEAIAKGEILPSPRAIVPKRELGSGMGMEPRGPEFMAQRDFPPSPRLLAPIQHFGGEPGARQAGERSPSHAPGTIQSILVDPGSTESQDTSAAAKRKRPSKGAKAKTPNPGESSFSVVNPSLYQPPQQDESRAPDLQPSETAAEPIRPQASVEPAATSQPSTTQSQETTKNPTP